MSDTDELELSLESFPSSDEEEESGFLGAVALQEEQKTSEVAKVDPKQFIINQYSQTLFNILEESKKDWLQKNYESEKRMEEMLNFVKESLFTINYAKGKFVHEMNKFVKDNPKLQDESELKVALQNLEKKLNLVGATNMHYSVEIQRFKRRLHEFEKLLIDSLIREEMMVTKLRDHVVKLRKRETKRQRMIDENLFGRIDEYSDLRKFKLDYFSMINSLFARTPRGKSKLDPIEAYLEYDDVKEEHMRYVERTLNQISEMTKSNFELTELKDIQEMKNKFDNQKRKIEIEHLADMKRVQQMLEMAQLETIKQANMNNIWNKDEFEKYQKLVASKMGDDPEGVKTQNWKFQGKISDDIKKEKAKVYVDGLIDEYLTRNDRGCEEKLKEIFTSIKNVLFREGSKERQIRKIQAKLDILKQKLHEIKGKMKLKISTTNFFLNREVNKFLNSYAQKKSSESNTHPYENLIQEQKVKIRTYQEENTGLQEEIKMLFQNLKQEQLKKKNMKNEMKVLQTQIDKLKEEHRDELYHVQNDVQTEQMEKNDMKLAHQEEMLRLLRHIDKLNEQLKFRDSQEPENAELLEKYQREISILKRQKMRLEQLLKLRTEEDRIRRELEKSDVEKNSDRADIEREKQFLQRIESIKEVSKKLEDEKEKERLEDENEIQGENVKSLSEDKEKSNVADNGQESKDGELLIPGKKNVKPAQPKQKEEQGEQSDLLPSEKIKDGDGQVTVEKVVTKNRENETQKDERKGQEVEKEETEGEKEETKEKSDIEENPEEKGEEKTVEGEGKLERVDDSLDDIQKSLNDLLARSKTRKKKKRKSGIYSSKKTVEKAEVKDNKVEKFVEQEIDQVKERPPSVEGDQRKKRKKRTKKRKKRKVNTPDVDNSRQLEMIKTQKESITNLENELRKMKDRYSLQRGENETRLKEKDEEILGMVKRNEVMEKNMEDITTDFSKKLVVQKSSENAHKNMVHILKAKLRVLRKEQEEIKDYLDDQQKKLMQFILDEIPKFLKTSFSNKIWSLDMIKKKKNSKEERKKKKILKSLDLKIRELSKRKELAEKEINLKRMKNLTISRKMIEGVMNLDGEIQKVEDEKKEIRKEDMEIVDNFKENIKRFTELRKKEEEEEMKRSTLKEKLRFLKKLRRKKLKGIEDKEKRGFPISKQEVEEVSELTVLEKDLEDIKVRGKTYDGDIRNEILKLKKFFEVKRKQLDKKQAEHESLSLQKSKELEKIRRIEEELSQIRKMSEIQRHEQREKLEKVRRLKKKKVVELRKMRSHRKNELDSALKTEIEKLEKLEITEIREENIINSEISRVKIQKEDLKSNIKKMKEKLKNLKLQHRKSQIQIDKLLSVQQEGKKALSNMSLVEIEKQEMNSEDGKEKEEILLEWVNELKIIEEEEERLLDLERRQKSKVREQNLRQYLIDKKRSELSAKNRDIMDDEKSLLLEIEELSKLQKQTEDLNRTERKKLKKEERNLFEKLIDERDRVSNEISYPSIEMGVRRKVSQTTPTAGERKRQKKHQPRKRPGTFGSVSRKHRKMKQFEVSPSIDDTLTTKNLLSPSHQKAKTTETRKRREIRELSPKKPRRSKTTNLEPSIDFMLTSKQKIETDRATRHRSGVKKGRTNDNFGKDPKKSRGAIGNISKSLKIDHHAFTPGKRLKHLNKPHNRFDDFFGNQKNTVYRSPREERGTIKTVLSDRSEPPSPHDYSVFAPPVHRVFTITKKPVHTDLNAPHSLIRYDKLDNLEDKLQLHKEFKPYADEVEKRRSKKRPNTTHSLRIRGVSDRMGEHEKRVKKREKKEKKDVFYIRSKRPVTGGTTNILKTQLAELQRDRTRERKFVGNMVLLKHGVKKHPVLMSKDLKDKLKNIKV